MSVETLEQKIAKQEERLRQLKAQKQAIAAREKKKNYTRRKILLGAWVLNKLKNDESFKGQLTDFEKFLSTESKTEENRQKDKDLFNGFIWDKT